MCIHILKVVTSILIFACFYTRRRHSSRSVSYKSILDDPNHELSLSSSSPSSSPSSRGNSSDRFLLEEFNDEDELSTYKYQPKRRFCCGAPIMTPNSSRFVRNWHSRALYKFPFFVEIFYWIITFVIYRMTHILSQEIFSDDIWDTAQMNGLHVLAVEQFTPLRFLLPVQEIEVQRWFMNGHHELLTFLNRFYALIHIPGTVLYETLRIQHLWHIPPIIPRGRANIYLDLPVSSPGTTIPLLKTLYLQPFAAP